MMFAVRFEVLAALVADQTWCRRLTGAQTTQEVVRVVADFTRAKGYKLVEVST